ncbi:unnamed protein product [Absidia cylindrospora]
MYGTYSYLGLNKSVPYQYLHQSFPTQHQNQHQPTPPALMQRQRRSWKTKATVVVSPPNLTIPEHPHSDRFLFPRHKHSSGYPVVFPRSKSVTRTRIHLFVSSLSNSKKKSNYALNTSPASTQHVSSPQRHAKTLTNNHLHQKQPTLPSAPGQQHSHQSKKYHQQDRHRFSATLDTHPVPPYRRFSHPENYGSQRTGSGAGQVYHYPYHRHNHHHQQQRHQQQQQHQQQYYQLTPSAYVYPPLSMTGYPPHGIYPQPHQHHSYYQPYQGQNHHHHYPTPYDIQTTTDSSMMDDDNDKQQRRISTNTNTDTTSTMSSSDLTPRRFSSGSTGSSSKSTLASSMGSVGIWNNDSTSSSASTKTTTTTVTTPAISSAAATAVTPTTAATKVDGSVHALEQSPIDQCNSSVMTHDPAATIEDDAQTADENNGSTTLATTLESKALDGTLTAGNDSTTACITTNNSNDNSDLLGSSSPQIGEQANCCPSTSSSFTSSTSLEPVSPPLSTTTTSESSSPSPSSAQPNSSTMTLPIWADPAKVRDNPTRYKVIQDYMVQHKLSYTSPLPLAKDIVFYFGDTKTTMANYRSSMQKLFSSSTVWNFSSCWRRYKEYSGRKPSEMVVNQNLYCFQKGVEPMWEDKVNKDGGRLILCPGKQISLDDLFDWLLCAFVGGQLADNGMVGLVLSRRARLDRIELWLDASSSTKLDTISSIKDKLLGILPVALCEPVESSHYMKHYDQ